MNKTEKAPLKVFAFLGVYCSPGVVGILFGDPNLRESIGVNYSTVDNAGHS